MTRTGYACIKTHFDRLYSATKIGTGLEDMRDSYKKAFGIPLGLYDIFTTDFRVSNNPIGKITTLIGPYKENPEIQIGIIPCMNALHSVSFVDKKFLNGIDDSNVREYMGVIMNATESIIRVDSLYNLTNLRQFPNPYTVFLNILPLYLTYYHIAGIDYRLLDNISDDVVDWLEKYACKSTEDAEKVLESMEENRFSETFEGIYKVVTCNNTISLFI